MTTTTTTKRKRRGYFLSSTNKKVLLFFALFFLLFFCSFFALFCFFFISSLIYLSFSRFVHSSWLFIVDIIKEKEGTHTHTQKKKKNVFSESASSKRIIMGKKEVRRFVSFRARRQKRRRKEELCFSRDDDERSFFNLLPGWGAPFFERMMMSRVARNNNNALFVAKREFVSLSVRQFLKNSFPSFYCSSSSPPQSKEVFVFGAKETHKSGLLVLSSSFQQLYSTKQTNKQTEAKNEQKRGG